MLYLSCNHSFKDDSGSGTTEPVKNTKSSSLWHNNIKRLKQLLIQSCVLLRYS